VSMECFLLEIVPIVVFYGWYAQGVSTTSLVSLVLLLNTMVIHRLIHAHDGLLQYIPIQSAKS
jgi:hypothetical protein